MVNPFLGSITFVNRLLNPEKKDRYQCVISYDGSDWSRLVNMRIRREKRQTGRGKRRADFWLMLHSKESPLWRCRQASRQGMVHWFIKGVESYQPSWAVTLRPSLGCNYTVSMLENVKQYESLEEAEKQWDSQATKLPQKGGKDAYWFWDAGEKGEPRPSRGALIRQMLAGPKQTRGYLAESH